MTSRDGTVLMKTRVPAASVGGKQLIVGSERIQDLCRQLPPEQFSVKCRGERALMSALLNDALLCYVKYRQPSRPAQRLLHDNAAAWFRSGDTAWPCSFENVCAVLGFDADAFRRRLWAFGARPLRKRADPLHRITWGVHAERKVA